MASEMRFCSDLSGLVKIFVQHDGREVSAPGVAYFVFNNYADTRLACERASKSWELYCVEHVPTGVESGKCLGFAVRSQGKGKAGISTMPELVRRINDWMGGAEKGREIPMSNIGRTELKGRDLEISREISDAFIAFADSLPEVSPVKKENHAIIQLLNDLKQLPQSEQRDKIIEKAEAGFYSNF